ncbi:MAG: hypothetical protein HKN04_00885 [Rhodothermaceae bacterium]|nr:hypothetical protein [Rhodothermaceae bacterium]
MPEEYFAWEEKQELKHEYDHGEVLSMSGSTANHALIIANLTGLLSNALRG